MQRENLEKQEIDWTRGRLPMWLKMLIAVAVVLLAMLVFFRVRTFEVYGNVHYTPEEIADTSGVTVGDILMGVSKTSTASRLIVKLPYVEEVTIEKRLPGTIRFHVKECTALAGVQSEFSTCWLVSRNGKLLEEFEEWDDQGDKPLITGVVVNLPTGGTEAVFDDSEKGQMALKVAGALEDAGILSRVTEIDVEDLDAVCLLYDGRINVDLGDGSEVDYKLGYLNSVLSNLTAESRGTLDLSFKTGDQAVFHPVA